MNPPTDDIANYLGELLRDESWRSWSSDDSRDELVMNEEDEILRMTRTHPEVFGRTYATDYLSDLAYPLMVFCDGRLNLSVETFVAVHNAYPKAVQIYDRNGWLPIHRACISDLSVDVVRFLHQQYPKSALIRGNFRSTPLHLACAFGGQKAGGVNTRDVIRYLIEACPEAVSQRNRNGDLPLHAVLRNENFPSTYRAEALRGLIRVAPSTISERDSSREIPLKLLLEADSFSSDTKLALVREFLAAYPQASMEVMHIPCLWGRRTSWDILQLVLGYHLWQTHKGKSLDYASRYPLHAILHVYKLSTNSFFLIDAISKFRNQSERLDDCDVVLPLHIAIRRSSGEKDGLPVSVVRELLALSPRAALVRDPKTGLYPFMAAARRVHSCNEEEELSSAWRDMQWLNLTYQLLRVEPHRFLSGVAAGGTDSCVQPFGGRQSS